MFPDGILYASRESHYSVFKAARMYRMECVKVGTLVTGEIDCGDFKSHLLASKDKPAIINVNIGTYSSPLAGYCLYQPLCQSTHQDLPLIEYHLCIAGTTVKGAVDDLDLVIQTLEDCGFSHDKFYIHFDRALFGLMMPFVKRVSVLV